MISIQLGDNNPKLKGENPKSGAKPDDKTDLLTNIIDKVNLMYQGNFSPADRVMVEGIFDKLQKQAGKKMKKQAAGNDENQFVDSIFPDIFDHAAQGCYVQQTEAYQKLFENPDFYQTLMKQMGHAMYERYKSEERSAYTPENLQQMMIPTLREEFVGIKTSARTLEEAFEWMIKVIQVKTIDKYNGLEDIILFPFYKLFCNPTTLTVKEKRMYLKSIATGFESYLKKLYYLIYNKEVTDKNGDIEHAALGNAIYCMKLNQLQYSQDESNKKFAQYLELLKDFRNDESHSGKELTSKEISLGIHIVTTMFVYVTFKNITELEMGDSVKKYPLREEETDCSMAAEKEVKKVNYDKKTRH